MLPDEQLAAMLTAYYSAQTDQKCDRPRTARKTSGFGIQKQRAVRVKGTFAADAPECVSGERKQLLLRCRAEGIFQNLGLRRLGARLVGGFQTIQFGFEAGCPERSF